jgi:glycosyltransferase involved in cell wall biosynthesis
MTRPRRIAFINTTAISLNQLMRGQLEFLRSRGAEIDLYSGGPEEELRALRKRQIGPVRYVPFRRDPNPFWDLLSLAWLVANLSIRRYDTVISSTPKALLVGSLAAFLTGQPRRIAWVRGRAYENFQGRKRQLYLALDRITFRVSHKVLFVAPSLISAYAADGLNLGDKGMLVGHGSSNGVDLDRFKPLSAEDRSKLRAELGLSPSDFVIVVVGRLRGDKGTNDVLELWRRLRDLKDLRILLVGRIEEAALRKTLRRGHDSQLRWFAPNDHVERFFQVADLHLFLSHREGFGNAAIEAAAVGVPTFGFDVVGLRDSIVDGGTGQLFPLGDVDSIERTIRAAMRDRDSLAGKYPRAREIVASRFAQQRVWNDYARILLDDAPDRTSAAD